METRKPELSAYSLENALKFRWASITGELSKERMSHLDRYVVGHTVLDAGCAGGAYSEYLRSKGFDVLGVDRMPEFLDCVPGDRRAFYRQADITDLPFPDQSFDCTYCFDVLEHVNDFIALKELIRVTKKRVILTVPHRNYDVFEKSSLTLSTYQDTTHLRYYSAESLAELIDTVTSAKFQIFGELRVPVHALCADLIQGQDQQHLLVRMLRQYCAFLIKVLLYLSRDFEKPYYASLVAIIDL